MPTPQPSPNQPPLAIVGMDCRLPSGDGLHEFWQSILSGHDAIRPMPADRLNRELYFGEKGQRGKTYAAIGGCVDDRQLDWSLLRIAPDDQANWDACHLNFYEVAARACRDAGLDPLRMEGNNIGVYVGHSGGTTLGGEVALQSLAPEYEPLLAEAIGDRQAASEVLNTFLASRPNRADGRPFVDASFSAGLVSHALGLRGPHMSIDAACASSLVALQLAASAIHTGQIDSAIVGGASYNKSDSLVLFSHARSCSATGSRPFDQDADGLVGSEGYVALIVKSLDQALRDGDRIHAVVRGIGMSSDGRGKSLWAPRKEGQFTAIERAYDSSLHPESVQFIEAHATSTQVGDATELNALSEFYQQHRDASQPIPVGSVKSNIGHTLETAGLAGIVKAVLAIQHRVLPPSINVQQLNRSVNWDGGPLEVNTQAKQIATEGNCLRSAVNAFGIGGLNVHVVLEEGPCNQATQARLVSARAATLSTPFPESPPVVIGRGIVVPGAKSVAELEQLAREQRAVRSTQGSNRNTASDRRLGYVSDFHYDWRKHRIPPKQIAQANPLQFMLLDAAQQAIEEAGGLTDDARLRTAVVVGSPFGGDFGNELFGGLRLPELRALIFENLRRRGVSEKECDERADAFEAEFLKRYPALLDETGSFTSSTLASRLSKTFDLMGGALAIDSGDASGAAAIDVSCQLLRSGVVDYVLCAAAHRALDAAAINNLQQIGRLPPEGSDLAVGEGVALVLLTREQLVGPADALASIGETRIAMAGSLNLGPSDTRPADGSLVGQVLRCTGDLQAVTPVCDLVCQTIESNPSGMIRASALSGLAYEIELGFAGRSALPSALERDNLSTGSVMRPETARDRVAADTVCPEPSSEQPQMNLVTIAADSRQDLFQLLSDGTLPDFSTVANGTAARALIGGDTATRDRRAKMLAAKLKQPAQPPAGVMPSLAWDVAQGSQADMPTKVAWVFPGQGSQRTGMLRSLCEQSPAAKNALRRADEALARLGEPSLSTLAWESENRLGASIWHTQACMLVADWIVAVAMRELNVRCDCIYGHSYGELPAMLAAGCWDLDTALLATRARCDAIAHAPQGLQLLSVNASDAQTSEQIRALGTSSLQISHRNAPLQHVVGGPASDITRLKELLDQAGVNCRLLPVPTAFHTDHLAPAVPVFQSALSDFEIRPAASLMLSSVHCRFLSDPHDFRAALPEQLTQQLDLVEATRRMRAIGITHTIEVGPGQVLSNLLAANSPHLVTLPTDPDCHDGSWEFVQEALDFFGLRQSPAQKDSARTHSAQQVPAFGNDSVPEETSLRLTPVHFDATAERRKRKREESERGAALQHQSISLAAKTIHHDATAARRESNRGLAQAKTTGALHRSSPVQPAVNKPAQSPGDRESSERTTVEPGSAQSSSQPVSSGGGIAEFLIDLIVEQTGYPKEIIELDWAFEADLGIDSIKKAQIFGELREYFDSDSATMLKLDDFVTLGDVVELLKSSAGKTDWLDGPGETRPSPSQQDAPSVASNSNLAATLIDFVVEQTGFPHEMVELEADLESDLGIDSIKKAQLLGEMRELGGLTLSSTDVGDQPLQLDSIKTLADILALLAPAEQTAQLESTPAQETTAKIQPTQLHTATSEARREPEALEPQPPVSQIVTPEAEEMGTEASESDASEMMVEMLIDFVVEQTGYPREIVELDADLEADLGIDSIKKAQLLGEVRDSITVSPATADAKLDLDQLKTLRDIAGLFSAQAPATVPSLENTDAPSSFLGTAGSKPLESTLSVSSANVRNFVAWRSRASHASTITRGSLATRTPDATAAFQHTLEPYVNWKTKLESNSQAYLDLPGWLMNAGNRPLEVTSDGDLRTIGVGGLDRQLAFVNAEQGRAVLPVGDTGTSGVVQQRLEAIACLEGSVESPAFTHAAVQATGDGSCLVADARSESLWLLDGNGLRKLDPNLNRLHGHSNGVALAPALRLECHSGRISIELHQGPYSRETLTFPEEPGSKHFPREEDSKPVRSKPEQSIELTPEELNPRDEITERFELRMVPSRQPEARGCQPVWSGAAVVVGDNPVAIQLEARLRGCGVQVWRLSGQGDETSLREQFKALAKIHTIAHLFLASALDPNAETQLSTEQWQQRKPAGLMASFWLAQAWTQHIMAADMTDDGSLIAISGLGGDFGISGQSYSLEGAGINGMLKAVMIELWMQGHRCLPIKTLDTSPEQSPAEIVDCVWRELAVPSFDNEISYAGGMRQVVRAIRRPARSSTTSTCRAPSGTWVCTGGARGITAYVAEQLASRFSLTLHLLGTTSMNGFDPAWRTLDKDGLAQLKRKVLTEAHQQKKNSIQAWQDTEKLIEIDATLQELSRAGIDAHYHVCDCSDIGQVESVLEDVRRMSGPITGVLHGAGIGKDSRFETKQPEKVHQCFAAKVDGSLALMEATRNDPLMHFLGFGSISGRFGANGHTDYSAANDMLCKQIAWYQRRRPEVRAIGFHWHAWGDVGMATKPETKLALEMIDMKFMPAKEGVRHIIRELASGSEQTEVLITDDRYYRAFYPAESLPSDRQSASKSNVASSPLLSSPVQTGDGEHEFTILVNPARDPFLTEHVLDGRPLLPIAVAAEMLAEAGEAASGKQATQLRDLKAVSALKFFHDEPQELSVRASSRDEIVQCELASRFVGRTGIASNQLRCNFTSGVVVSGISSESIPLTRIDYSQGLQWQRAAYPQPSDKFYVGWSLQKLRKFALVPDGLVGKIIAPILIELAGNRKDTSQWRVPSAALDACLFATGIFAWNRIRPGVALPAQIARLSLGRRPRPGEACEVHLRPMRSDSTTADFNFTLYGFDGEMILNAESYRVAWLSAAGTEASQQTYSESRS